jgi:hypothetical protein
MRWSSCGFWCSSVVVLSGYEVAGKDIEVVRWWQVGFEIMWWGGFEVEVTRWWCDFEVVIGDFNEVMRCLEVVVIRSWSVCEMFLLWSWGGTEVVIWLSGDCEVILRWRCCGFVVFDWSWDSGEVVIKRFSGDEMMVRSSWGGGEVTLIWCWGSWMVLRCWWSGFKLWFRGVLWRVEVNWRW